MISSTIAQTADGAGQAEPVPGCSKGRQEVRVRERDADSFLLLS